MATIMYVASEVFLGPKENVKVTYDSWRAVPSNTTCCLCVMGEVTTHGLLLWGQTADVIHLCCFDLVPGCAEGLRVMALSGLWLCGGWQEGVGL